MFLFGDSKVKWSLSAHKFDIPAQEVISHGGKQGNGCEMVSLGQIFRVPEMCHLIVLAAQSLLFPKVQDFVFCFSETSLLPSRRCLRPVPRSLRNRGDGSR